MALSATSIHGDDRGGPEDERITSDCVPPMEIYYAERVLDGIDVNEDRCRDFPSKKNIEHYRMAPLSFRIERREEGRSDCDSRQSNVSSRVQLR